MKAAFIGWFFGMNGRNQFLKNETIYTPFFVLVLMKFSVLLLLSFLIFKVSFAQKEVRGNSSSTISASLKANIDNLNTIAHDVYLTLPDSARKIAENALMLSQQSNYSLGKGRSFYNIGQIYWSQSYYTISLFYLNSAIDYLPESNPLDLSDCYNSLGRTYADLENYTLALANLDKSLYFAGADTGRKAEAYSERAYVYCKLKNYDKAIQAAQYALKLNLAINATGNIAVIYARLGIIYRLKSDYHTALSYDDIALSMSKKTFNKRLRAKLYSEYALINNAQHNYEAAIDYANKGVALADSIGVIDAQTNAYKALVETYELKNDPKQALVYQKKYNSIKDSVNAAARLKTIKLIQNYYALNSRLNSIALMEANGNASKAKIKFQDKLILVLSLSLLVLISVLSITYYLYKEKKHLSSQLEQQHNELSDQKDVIVLQAANLQSVNGLKDKLLAVIGHDLRTPVANLSSIVEMFSDGYLTVDEVNDLMKNMNPIVKGAELTLSNLTEWAGSQIKGRNITLTNVDIFLLGVEMEQTFLHPLQLKNIEFNNLAYPGQGVLADENHLKVILRNLISNAIKFTHYNGVVTLSTIIEKDQLIISLKDSGKGLTPDEIKKLFYLDTHFSYSGTSGETGTGIGLLLCKELVELNGGKLNVRSEIGRGSTFYFNLPLIRAYA
ncbi:tetratricopeptide repeat-containing sensor histidine kinase [Mucilaginibacter sp.]|uniref:tetratricopeptide repeat-containing sensor histidine kinase n=1 Tax=Mucilaginibacter sp. TaxID=1882438 RepID=UPI003D0C54E8